MSAMDPDDAGRDPLGQLRAALLGAEARPAGAEAHPDPRRQQRTGVPEVILAERKSAEQTIAIARELLERTGRAIISRVPDAMLPALREQLGPPLSWEHEPAAGLVIVRAPGQRPPSLGGQVGLLSAGTSDIPAALEAAALCREMGCAVHAAYDVGVAGLHRLIAPLERLLSVPVDVIIVAAGMDGALPSVVAGLVDVPVIGLPTPVGYGMGGQGEAALLSMLQTCVPGLAAVNIGNGVGAAAVAARIANRVAAARRLGGDAG